ncbi:MAG: right-handed parallel beta-helix repeat-containing protein, partial [Candidatus Schekmanbacteria bacterium]|nr:right-handed parallel beta-helix repeat-containing protein [Candidatus Schekmanbacteria bacterium]
NIVRACTPPLGYVVNKDDCNDKDQNIYPGVTQQTTCGGLGACSSSVIETCSAGVWSGNTCVPGNPGAEICDNIDNDCDGVVDEDLTQQTTCGVGACSSSVIETCSAGVWGNNTCVPGSPGAEICDNIDNDCDGVVDEDLAQQTTCGVGACSSSGTKTCSAGVWGGNTCVPGNSSAEICDNIDNDCDGQIDEGLTQRTTCGGLGACSGSGTKTCSAGVWGNDTCVPGSPGIEICDNIDNDCDGAVDEDLAQQTTCGVGACSSSGTKTCSAGVWGSDTCVPGSTKAEVCDNIDNDCDGQTDEGFITQYYLDADQDGYGNLSVTTEACSPPAGFVSDKTDCDDNEANSYPGALEICDGKDNDCDGPKDEDIVCDWDKDGLPDEWEYRFFANLSENPDDDADQDGYSNQLEWERGCSPITAVENVYVDINSKSGTENGSLANAYKTVQKGIDNAACGDTVIVAKGVYKENIDLKGKVLILRGSGAETIMDGAGQGSVVTFNSGETDATVLDGFVIRNGSAGGISVSNNSSPLIYNSMIYSNKGTGISCDSGYPEIINNTIADNTISSAVGIRGVNGSQIRVLNTIIWGPSAALELDATSQTAVEYSDVKGGYTGQGNIDADPLFVDPVQRNYHLQTGSPCINTATGVDAPADDIDEDSRPQDGQVDMGADEYKVVEPSPDSSTNKTSGGGGGGGGGCFIATAAFGTPMAPEVKTLQRFRDNQLKTFPLGEKFVTTYYKISPPIADFIKDKDYLKAAVRGILKPVIWVVENFFGEEQSENKAEAEYR